MEEDLVIEDLWEGENHSFDEYNEDILNFDGERCGICMDVVVDRGVFDCCHHWFCFACIDNWATITSLCPLCQNEFQLITCVPVYDTVGGYKTDEDANQRDDDWFIEGKNNSLSFPSYYIDENAVVCLDENGCRIRSGSVEVEEDLDIDTSIACDLCDKWYHAFCVGFNPESSSDSSWLCPRCTVDYLSQKSDAVSASTQSHQHDTGVSGSDHLVKSSFSERVSVSVVDDGETAIVISLLEGNQGGQETKESVPGCGKDMNYGFSSHITNRTESEANLADRNGVQLSIGQKASGFSLSQDISNHLSQFTSTVQLNKDHDADKRAQRYLDNRLQDSGFNFDVDLKHSNEAEDHVTRYVGDGLKEHPLPADKIVPNKMEVPSLDSSTLDEKEAVLRVTNAKRKLRNKRNVDDGELATIEDHSFQKKVKTDGNNQSICVNDQTAEPDVDISAIVQERDHKPRRHLGHKTSDAKSKGRENTAGLRLKKIMRRTGDDIDSAVLVQELRRKIREAVHDRGSKEHGKQLFDPKLLEAFRTALAGSSTENVKPILDVKAKKSLLQKGKVRESLTKKIYGSGGKRRRAWTRECEVEFWKHRCIKATKPEKIETLNSVLNQLRYDSGYPDNTSEKEDEANVSILSRLYLADTSVFPRKTDIMPASALKDMSIPDQKRESSTSTKATILSSIDHSDRISSKNCLLLGTAPALNGKGSSKGIKGLQAETASSDGDKRRFLNGSSIPESDGMNISPEVAVCRSDTTKIDKRKWALEVLSRKTASSSKNSTEKRDEDSAILKGNYTLLAQLPKEMRPILAPSCHNKISISVRQAQLYRLAEHYLKKVNSSSVSRTAEIELAVADAVNIEKEVADKSNCKLVYVNLCSQELMRRSGNMTEESNACSLSKDLSGGAEDETDNGISDLVVDEALRNTGLISDSPPNSPTHPGDHLKVEVSPEKNEDEGPENVFEVVSHPELDIYGDFEYKLEDNGYIGAGSPNISELHTNPRIKLVFSSHTHNKANGMLDLHGQDGVADLKDLKGKPDLLECDYDSVRGSTLDGRLDNCTVQSCSLDGNEEPSSAECEELYGPDKEPLVQKYPKPACTKPVDQIVGGKFLGDDADMEKDLGQSNGNHMENSKEATDANSSSVLNDSSCLQKGENVTKENKTNKDSKRQKSESYSTVMHKVEAYVKEHIRPLCRSGVITVDQYRWAVQKTTEKVMKYHSNDKSANFLIKEGEKVKKLAEQYVEAAQQKAK